MSVVACAPASVAEAEARRDVAWLDANGSRGALEALGRIADHEPKAATVIAQRTGNQDAYHAAWLAHTRGAAWGDAMLHAALASPSELPVAVAELPFKDPRLEDFASDLQKGIAAAEPATAAAAVSILATLGPAAEEELVKLLDEPSTRAATCAGLAAKKVSAESRLALTLASPAARADAACRQTFFQHATTDGRVLAWMAKEGEPDVLLAAAAALPCLRVAELWDLALASPRATFVPLEPALTASAGRCPQTLDAVLGRVIPSQPSVRLSVLRALSADAAHTEHLPTTCHELPRLEHGKAIDPEVRALAERVHDHNCAMTPHLDAPALR